MPIFPLAPKQIAFPPARFADSEGLLAEGPGITAEQVIEAFEQGLFFWFHPMRYTQWWSPDPRIVLKPEQAQNPNHLFENNLIDYSIQQVNDPERILRMGQKIWNTGEMNPFWITERTLRLYNQIAEKAEMVALEAIENSRLVGGMIAFILGKAGFSEMIIGEKDGVREMVLYHAARLMREKGIELIDLHKESNETQDIGLLEMSRNEYLDRIQNLINS